MCLEEGTPEKRRRTIRSALLAAFIFTALIFAAIGIWGQRGGLAQGLHRMSVLILVLALLCGAISVTCTLLLWRTILRGFGAYFDIAESAQVYFISQLGKYIPGSIWPVIAQMELARRHKVERATMLTGGVLAVVLNAVVGGVLACLLLPFASPDALKVYWWLMMCVPVLIIGMHPKIVFTCMNWLLARLKRRLLVEQLSIRTELKAGAWGLLSWIFLGASVYVFVAGLGVTGIHAFAASIAAACLAVSVGILLIPLPAGVGVREVAFVVCLAPILDHTDGLLVALLLRVVLVLSDIGLGGAAALRKRFSDNSRYVTTG